MDGEGPVGFLVVVPHAPGPLTRPDQRHRDELDELIDDLFPPTDGGPSWFDGVLLAGGAGLVAWALLTGGPGAVVAVGVALFLLGCLLPLRSLFERVGARRRATLLERGVPLAVREPSAAALVEAYESLLNVDGLDLPARAAAHAALLEAATLLQGRSPESDRERAYVEARTAAIGELAAALRSPSREPLLDAREELDLIGGVNSLTRLDELTQEARGGDGRARGPGG